MHIARKELVGEKRKSSSHANLQTFALDQAGPELLLKDGSTSFTLLLSAQHSTIPRHVHMIVGTQSHFRCRSSQPYTFVKPVKKALELEPSTPTNAPYGPMKKEPPPPQTRSRRSDPGNHGLSFRFFFFFLYIGDTWRLYGDNGKENGKYYIGVILGKYWDHGKENGNYYSI